MDNRTVQEQVPINYYKRAIRDISRESIIRFQLVVHCYLKNIHINDARLKCLTILGIVGETDLSQFCNLIMKEGILISDNSIRSRLTELEDANLILKNNGKYRKTVQLHPDLKIQTKGNVMVDVKLLSMESESNVSEETERDNS